MYTEAEIGVNTEPYFFNTTLYDLKIYRLSVFLFGTIFISD